MLKSDVAWCIEGRNVREKVPRRNVRTILRTEGKTKLQANAKGQARSRQADTDRNMRDTNKPQAQRRKNTGV